MDVFRCQEKVIYWIIQIHENVPINFAQNPIEN